jgi:hypothetical protein
MMLGEISLLPCADQTNQSSFVMLRTVRINPCGFHGGFESRRPNLFYKSSNGGIGIPSRFKNECESIRVRISVTRQHQPYTRA